MLKWRDMKILIVRGHKCIGTNQFFNLYHNNIKCFLFSNSMFISPIHLEAKCCEYYFTESEGLNSIHSSLRYNFYECRRFDGKLRLKFLWRTYNVAIDSDIDLQQIMCILRRSSSNILQSRIHITEIMDIIAVNHNGDNSYSIYFLYIIFNHVWRSQ